MGGTAGQNMANARGTMSSATSGFKWNANNRMLAPAFRGNNKENGAAEKYLGQ